MKKSSVFMRGPKKDLYIPFFCSTFAGDMDVPIRFMFSRKHIHTVIAYLPVVGFLLLIASLPFHYDWVQRLSLYILGISYPIDYLYNRRWEGWHWTRDKWVYVVMILLFLLTPLWQLFDSTPPTEYYKWQLHQRSAFVWVSVTGLLGFSPHLHTRHVGVVMLLTGIYMFALTLYGYLSYDLPIWDMGVFKYYRAHHINSHMVMNLYMNTALIFGALGMEQWNKKRMRYVVTAMMLIKLRTNRWFGERKNIFYFDDALSPFWIHNIFGELRNSIYQLYHLQSYGYICIEIILLILFFIG